MNINNAEFIKSAASETDFPLDRLPQIVFAGRSNVGKSSVINTLLNRKNFARVGASPGKTAHINFFRIDGRLYFVDLPGYGYAKVSKQEKERWGLLLERYFDRGGISLGVLAVDIRIRPTADDKIMADWFQFRRVPFLILANKSDKLKQSQRKTAADRIRETLGITSAVKLIAFSSVTGEGRGELLFEINRIR